MSMVEGISSAVEGSGLNVYVLIWPIEADGPWWVQETNIKSDGSWESQAYFGRVGVIDKGKNFKIIAIITKQELNKGETLLSLPTARVAESKELQVTRN
ncbi:hypothetical protein A7K50_12355 [Dehalobacter sp. MCB1]|nr:hypothetical protein A7K50_12355 [Dehalobacter sp. MCB1]